LLAGTILKWILDFIRIEQACRMQNRRKLCIEKL
jgi:hypothetical protein